MKLSTTYSHSSSIATIDNSGKSYRQYFLINCVFYLVVAGVLAVLVQFGVMDEDFHLDSSLPFAHNGVNLTTLYRHVPPTGVASHIWFAFWLWLIPGINYIGLRLTTCIALLLLALLAYGQLRTYSVESQRKILAVSLFTLVCPYFFLSVSTVMTEGPGLFFLFAGLLLVRWSRLQQLLPFFLGCMLLGLATIARFYYIPLLPALFIVLLLTDWEHYAEYGFAHVLASKWLLYVCIGTALLPLIGLIVLWGGLTPPLFHQWSKLRSGISFNGLRPLSALALTGVYAAPFVLLNIDWRSKLFLRTLAFVVPVALLLAALGINLFHDASSVDDVTSGPVEHTLQLIQTKNSLGLSIGLFVVYSLSFLTLALVIQKLFRLMLAEGFADKGLVFSVLFVAFFIASQAFVGGNHPFFERYLIHPWPFLGYILVVLFPRFLNPRTYLVLAGYTILSVLILIKWGIQ
jgi:hypothetical protein